jgi:hypothetical protein
LKLIIYSGLASTTSEIFDLGNVIFGMIGYNSISTGFLDPIGLEFGTTTLSIIIYSVSVYSAIVFDAY